MSRYLTYCPIEKLFQATDSCISDDQVCSNAESFLDSVLKNSTCAIEGYDLQEICNVLESPAFRSNYNIAFEHITFLWVQLKLFV